MNAEILIAIIGLVMLAAVLRYRLEDRKYERNGSLWCGPGGRKR